MLNRYFNISEEAYEQVRDYVRIGQHRDLAIKGKTGTYSLHEVVGLAALEGDGHPEAAPSHVA